MATASLGFLAFAALAAIIHNIWNNRLWRAATFLLVNLVFLASFSTGPLAFVPLVAFLVAGYAAMHIARTWSSTSVISVLVLGIIVGFCWLKKYWFLESFGFLQHPYLTIGLSYIFFRILHLVIDLREGSIEKPLDGLTYLNYTLNFATLVAGPIQRYQDFARPRQKLTVPAAGLAMERIVIGLFKVLVLSMLVSTVQTQATADLSADMDFTTRVETALLAVGLYPIYLYFNFSGYTDIVVGVARFVGLQLPENFNRPFSSLNFIDFWSRWHITLSGWMRDYVFTPLLKALMSRFPSPRVETLLAAIAFFVTFFLMGVWHGPTPMFLLFGAPLALGVSVNKIYQNEMVRRLGRQRYRSLARNPFYQACTRGLTYTWYAVTLVCFWATGDEATRLVSALGAPGIAVSFIALFVLATVILAIFEAARSWVLAVSHGDTPLVLSRYLRTVWATVAVFVAVVVVAISESPAPDIVYKSF